MYKHNSRHFVCISTSLVGLMLCLTLLATRALHIANASQIQGQLGLNETCGFYDDFHSNLLDEGWAWIDPGSESSYALVDNSIFQVNVPTGNNDLFPGNNHDAPRLLRSVTGDFSITSRVEFMPAFEYQGAGILIWQNVENMLRLEHGYGGVSGSPQSGVGFSQQVDGIFEILASRLDHPTDSPIIYLRLTRVGDHFSGYYSTDSIVWVEIGDATLAYNETLEIGFAVINQHQDNPIEADFDFVQVQAPCQFLPVVN